MGLAWCMCSIISLVLRQLIGGLQGGGSTFGVIISTTIAAWPSVPLICYNVTFGTLPDSEAYWDSMAYWLSQYPALAEVGLAGYGDLESNTSVDGINYGGFGGVFLLPVLSPQNTTASVAAAIDPILAHINATWPGYFQFSTNSMIYPSFYDWWLPNNGPDYGGIDIMVGSRLLPAEALTANLTALKVALQGFNNPQANDISVDLVSGKGVWNAVPRGGSDAVNPAWRKAVVHVSKYTSPQFLLLFAVLFHCIWLRCLIMIVVLIRNLANGVEWNYLDAAGKAEQLNLLTNTYVEALRLLAPESGAYINEAE